MSQKSYDNKPSLYLIPTPIGNMEDITLRAINILKQVDVVFSEDTRETAKLLNYLEINKKLISCHKFNEDKVYDKVLEYLSNGISVGLVSDRGTPAISDPGYVAAYHAIKEGYNVIGLPGATAFVPALIMSGINPNKFMCSIEALSRRVQKSGVLPEIDPIVDLGNAISLKYLLAVGAHDLANAQENSIAVRFSEAGDLFRPMGTLTDEAVPEGELVYVSRHQVKTRRFIWRQSDDGKITNLTTEYLIPLDGFIGTNDDDVIKARDEFASLLTEWFGASVSTGFVSKENNIFNF